MKQDRVWNRSGLRVYALLRHISKCSFSFGRLSAAVFSVQLFTIYTQPGSSLRLVRDTPRASEVGVKATRWKHCM